jgi:PAS domain S-box-containing protein
MTASAKRNAKRNNKQLGQLLELKTADLVDRYYEALRETLFESRSELRPSMLRGIAEDEATTFLHFFKDPIPAAAEARGVKLCQAGLSEQAILHLGKYTRQFLLSHLTVRQFISAVEVGDTYFHSALRGFLTSHGELILAEQERLRSALQRTLGRYSIQMEVAANVAGATTSILDPYILLNTAVELIRERFDLYYVGLFLTDDKNQWVLLRAGTGEAGKEMLRQGYRIYLNSNSMISKCVVGGEPQVAIDIGREPASFENPLLPNTHSEAAIPLRFRGTVIGALSVQSQLVGAFADLDVTALRILADQLANAIENARLFDELRHSEGKYRTILETIEEGYYEIDLNGNYTFANDALSRLIEIPKNKILGVNYQQLVETEDIDKLKEAYKLARETGIPVRGIEYKIRSKITADVRDVETSALLIRDAAANPVGIRGIVHDITARKQAEQYLIERKALERSNSELEQFAYVASHALQEPLRKIQAFGDRLSIKSGSTLSVESRQYLERMLDAASRSQKLINDLLSLSRIATKGQPFVPVNLAEVAREVVFDLEARIEQTGGHVEIGDLPTIEADLLQMSQLLLNLIVNGLKFHKADEKPVVKVHSEIVMETGVTAGKIENIALCKIFVEDNGIGFDEKYLPRIFQPFQRLNSSGEFEGTGIGLSVCRAIAERHRGSITAKSQPEHGATFIVTLPVHQKNDVVP